MNWETIALLVVTIGLAVAGGLIKHFVNLLHESGELLTQTAEAFEDGKLTKKEFVAILKEAKDVADAWAKIVGLILKKK